MSHSKCIYIFLCDYAFLLLAKCSWFTSNISKLSCTSWYDDDNGNDDDTVDEKGNDDGDDNGFDWTEILDDVIVCILVD